MGVKSTVDLTREEAEEKFAELLLGRESDLSKLVRDKAHFLSNSEMERILMEWNDERANGEGFENYNIVEKPEPSFG